MVERNCLFILLVCDLSNVFLIITKFKLFIIFALLQFIFGKPSFVTNPNAVCSITATN
jgi:hypothetical protein